MNISFNIDGSNQQIVPSQLMSKYLDQNLMGLAFNLILKACSQAYILKRLNSDTDSFSKFCHLLRCTECQQCHLVSVPKGIWQQNVFGTP